MSVCPPRLTWAMRQVSGVSQPLNEFTHLNPSQLLEKRRQRCLRMSKENGVSFDMLRKALISASQSGEKSHVEDKLRELYGLAKEISNNEAHPDIVSTSAVFLFELLMNTDTLTMKQFGEIKRIFGPVPERLVNKACKTVNQLYALIDEEAIERLFNEVKMAAEKKKTQFGLKYKYVEVDLYSKSEFISFPDNDLTKKPVLPSETFSLRYDSSAANSTEPVVNGDHIVSRDYIWLLREIKSRFQTKLNNVDDLLSSTLALLTSDRPNDQLQGEMFDLLGFDCFEFIHDVLENRISIVHTAQFTPHTDRGQQNGSTNYAHLDRRPACGAQVIVQSESEKQLMKQMKKEEKKQQRFMSKYEGCLSETEKLDLEYAASDPAFLRTQRETALQAARNAPLFSNKKEVHCPVRYPHVYDSQLDAKLLPGSIGGAKLSLPADTVRINTKVCEEVTIPASTMSAAGVGDTLTLVKELDDLCQAAFAGSKSLNRIQSIVYDTAYNTAHNMLICAPTGAGKTNIAMLTVLHELREHYENGKVKKEEFKIVYIAPMKALAAEMTANFGKRLQGLGVQVRELTGDMQLSKSEIAQTQMIVTTPEKWDVITRKSTGDVGLSQIVKLLIIDEIHLLHGDRGPVVEAVIARTLRQVESSQKGIRIVGLSATLPNYLDVGRFLRVNPSIGLFYFDGRFRPVPLSQTFVGVKARSIIQQIQDMDTICYEKVFDVVRRGQQVMVFVHARNTAVKTAMNLREEASNRGESDIFNVDNCAEFGRAKNEVERSRNKQLRDLFVSGFAFHHAGMLRSDRSMVEKLFSQGLVKVLCCTSTLAWGVNLPAHAVIIKGTEIYDAKKGSFVDLGILDVLQIFGRAGRPQYDTSGHGTIITTHEKLAYYLSLLTCQYPIESSFDQGLVDNLNAEIVLGTVSNVDEAVVWLTDTYWYIRMKKNPTHYGLRVADVQDDPSLKFYLTDVIHVAAHHLCQAKMINYQKKTGVLGPADLGRTASYFYIKFDTIMIFNEEMERKNLYHESDVFNLVSQATEFSQLKIREEEQDELQNLVINSCKYPVAGGVENVHGKVNALLQSFVSHVYVDSFSLLSDQAHITQSAVRIIRALFEIFLKKNKASASSMLLELSKVVEWRIWPDQTPFRQFNILTADVIYKLESKKLRIDYAREMDFQELGRLINHNRMGITIKKCAWEVPQLIIDATFQPVTRTVLRVTLQVYPDFTWNDKVHHNVEGFHIWIEDSETDTIYHYEHFLISKRQVMKKEKIPIVFTIPITEPLPSQYLVHASSDRWMGSTTQADVSLKDLILPEQHAPHTELLELEPLSIRAFNNPDFEKLFNITHFNPIQTQVFHTLYHTDNNVLLGAPTGSGKTLCAEVAIFRVMRMYPGLKSVYIAPLKALVRERIDDWKERLDRLLGRKVIELTGDITPDMRALATADVIVTTPEKWDGISRSWQTRGYVRSVALIVFDEIHLLGEDRGPVLEVIVSRTNFIVSETKRNLRIIGLSTALANASDLAHWLGINEIGLFNFRASTRPVPITVHVQGYPGKHYCPRMATMNKPSFQAIRMHSPEKPVLIFVSSRRQTRLTALDLIAYVCGGDNHECWLHMSQDEKTRVIERVKDVNLKLTLSFGIGLHHAGLEDKDRKIIEDLFLNQKIQILISTATLAWGVNLPAHLVIVKGTEYFDGKIRRYVDFPVTDILQMVGRAGRPQFDDSAVAVVMVHDVKKMFYKKFMYEPFPVESCLLDVLPDHLNAEIVAGTIGSKQECMDYLTRTYFFCRLLQNPAYYHLQDPSDQKGLNSYLSSIISKDLGALIDAGCVEVEDDNRTLNSTVLGRIASFYYLHHSTLQLFKDTLKASMDLDDVLKVMCGVHEYSEIPVRHNEDLMNADFAKICPITVEPTFDSPHTKAHLLFQGHFGQLCLPCSDYELDLKSVLDQAIRVLQAMIDVSSNEGYLATVLQIIHVLQMVLQGRFVHESPLLQLPHFMNGYENIIARKKLPPNVGADIKFGVVETIPQLQAVCNQYEKLAYYLREVIDETDIEQIYKVLFLYPRIRLDISVRGYWQIDGGVSMQKPYSAQGTGRYRRDTDWLDVHADQQYTISVSFTRLNRERKKDTKAIAPRFSKPKDEGWFLILGDVECKELLAIKRVSCIVNKSNAKLTFYTPEKECRWIVNLYLMSDCYLGFDQQYEICFNVIPSSFECQVNTEIGNDEDAF